jgi:hypothetical protein
MDWRRIDLLLPFNFDWIEKTTPSGWRTWGWRQKIIPKNVEIVRCTQSICILPHHASAFLTRCFPSPIVMSLYESSFYGRQLCEVTDVVNLSLHRGKLHWTISRRSFASSNRQQMLIWEMLARHFTITLFSELGKLVSNWLQRHY